jgi:hypothetical protein
MTTENAEKISSRINIIQAVRTPLGFFSLTVLVVEAILGVTANFSQGTDRTYLIVGMLILIFSLVSIVAGFAFFRPEALSGIRPAPDTSRPDVSQLPPAVESVSKPSLLLATASHEYTQPYLEKDIKIIEALFSKRQIKVSRGITSAQLRDLLTDNRYDVLHLTIPVDKDSGSLKFDNDEQMPAEAFAKLAETCGAKLVVLAICDSLMLAARIARTTNMISALDTIQNENDFLEWERTFYKMLSRGQPLSRAYEFARSQANARMVLLMTKDFAITSK